MIKSLKISSKGLELIKKYEGFFAKPYLCPAGVPTIGYGTTYYPNGTKVTLQDPPITEQTASAILLDTLVTYERSVDSYTRDDINQNQFDALVSFCYNLGAYNLKKSTLLKKVNNNPNDPTIENEFNRWVRAGGRKLKGLVRRRAEEAELYFS